MFIPLHDDNALKHIKLQYVTLVIIAINVLVWLVQATPMFTSQEALRAQVLAFGFIPAVVNDMNELPLEIVRIPETLSYISYSFLHGDFMHLAGNMLFLWVFGDNIEDALGHFRFLIFYLLSAIVAAFAHSLLDPSSTSPLIGASGAASGVTIAYLMLHPRVNLWVLALGRIPLRISAMIAIGAWIALQVYSMITSEGGGISFAAHLGGLVAGAILLPIMKRPGVVLFDRSLVVEPQSPATPVPGGSVPSIKSSKTSNPQWGRGERD